MTSKAIVHDIDVARQKRRTPSGAPSHDARLVAFVREQLAASKQWKIVKNSPTGRNNLICMARNLHGLLKRVPHGKKKHVLALAGFGGGKIEGASSYASNITIACDPVQVSKKQFDRLSPNLAAYVKVAEKCPPYGDAAIAQLFRGTLWEARLASNTIRTSWMRELSENLRRAADAVAERTDLRRLFDRMSEANLCILEGKRHDMAATGWLSVTFHKTIGRPPEGEEVKPFWLLDREDQCVPLGGAALFSPKVELSRSEMQFNLEQIVREEPEPVTIEHGHLIISTSLYLAILPVADDLDQPASIEPAFLLRPSMRLQTSEGAVPIAFAGPKDEKLNMAWQNPVTQELFIYNADADLAEWSESIRQTEHLSMTNDDNIDFEVELWRVLPFAAPECEAILTGPAEGLQFAAPPPADIIRDRLLMPLTGVDEIDLSAIVPGRFAPQDTIASHLQRSLVAPSPIIQALEADALAYRAAFERVVEAASSLINYEDFAAFKGNPD